MVYEDKLSEFREKTAYGCPELEYYSNRKSFFKAASYRVTSVCKKRLSPHQILEMKPYTLVAVLYPLFEPETGKSGLSSTNSLKPVFATFVLKNHSTSGYNLFASKGYIKFHSILYSNSANEVF